MQQPTIEDEIREALAEAGVGSLPPAVRQWLADRLARWGYTPAAINVGGLRCTAPHVHGTGDGCIKVAVGAEVHDLARFPSWRHATRALVATAMRAGATAASPAPDLPLVGYRSAHPVEGETSGTLSDFAQRAAEIVDPLGSQLLWGPSSEAEATFRGLLADWEAFERAGVPTKIPELRETYDTWVKFRDEWLSGHGDELMLNSIVADSNRVRRTLAEKAGQPDPELRPGVDPDKLNARIQVLEWVNQRTKNILPPGTKVPLWVLLAGGGVVMLVLGAPLIQALGSLGGRTIVVQTPAPAPAPEPREKRAR